LAPDESRRHTYTSEAAERAERKRQNDAEWEEWNAQQEAKAAAKREEEEAKALLDAEAKAAADDNPTRAAADDDKFYDANEGLDEDLPPLEDPNDPNFGLLAPLPTGVSLYPPMGAAADRALPAWTPPTVLPLSATAPPADEWARAAADASMHVDEDDDWHRQMRQQPRGGDEPTGASGSSAPGFLDEME